MRQSNSWLRRVARDYAISLAFWLAASLPMAWQMYGFQNGAVTFRDVFLIYAARYLSVALLTPPIFYAVSRWPVTGSPLRRTIAYGLGFVPFQVGFGVIRWLIFPVWLWDTRSWQPRSLDSLSLIIYSAFADQLFMYLGVAVAAHAYAYFVRGQRQEIERLQLSRSLAQSELQTLRAQLHPHFLFNTLQGVSTLIDTDRGTAQNMLLTLAALLRKVLQYGSSDLIAFREELAFVESYLQLEQMRLGRRLEVRWQITPDVHTALIPQLLLQPLIENAIVHGIANSRGGGWIEIEAHLHRGQLVVVIRNSISGASPSGLGVGIKNTKARLKYLYGEDAAFEFEILETGIAVARFAVPAFTAGLAQAVTA
ncbi:MAG: histidine kinase [Steroidobacteraceae bacterium]